MESRSSFITKISSSLKKVLYLGRSATPSVPEAKKEDVPEESLLDFSNDEESLPDFSNDPVIEGFKQFHAIPIVKFVQDYLQGKIDDELFFIRIRYLNKQDAAILSKWVKEEFAKENPETSARHLLFMGMAYYYGLGLHSDAKAKEYLLKAIEKGSTLAISFYAHTLVQKLSSKIEYLQTAIKGGDKLAYSFLSDLYKSLTHKDYTKEGEDYIVQGVKKDSIYAQYHYALILLGAFGFFMGSSQAIQFLKPAAISGLPSSLNVLAKLHSLDSDNQRAAYYYHYAFLFEQNTYTKEVVNRSGDKKIFNHPLQLVSGSTDLFTHYCLAGGIGHIIDTEVHKNFASKFKKLVNKNPKMFEKLFFNDPTEGCQQVLKWLDENFQRSLAIKLNHLHFLLNDYPPNTILGQDIIRIILYFAFGKQLKSLLDSDVLSAERRQEKQAQILLHEFQLKEKALLPKTFSIFRLKPRNQTNAEEKGIRYKASKLQASLPEIELGDISYSSALIKARK